MTRIVFRPRAVLGLRNASKEIQEVINRAIKILEQGSIPLHTKKLGGFNNGYRIRIGRWRILFVLGSNQIEVVDIFLKKGPEDYRQRT